MRRLRSEFFVVLAMILALTLLCSGCWDRTELEDIAWVEAVGFDKGPKGTIVTTMDVAVPRGHSGASGGQGSGGQQSQKIVISVASETGLEAFGIAAVSLGRRLSLQHSNLYVFGEEFAKADVRGLVSAMERFREVRGTAFIAVAKGRAEDVMRAMGSPLELSTSRYIQTVIQQHHHSGLFETQNLAQFIDKMEVGLTNPTAPLIGLAPGTQPQGQSGSGQSQGQSGGMVGGQSGGILPAPKIGQTIEPTKVPVDPDIPQSGASAVEAGSAPRIGGGPVEIIGTALFSGGKMVGTLTGEETRGLLMLKNDMERAAFSIPDPMVPDKPPLSLSVDIRGRGADVKATRNGEKVEIDVIIKLLVTYLAPKTGADYTDPRAIPLAEKACEEYAKQLVDGVIAKTQKELKTDVLGFGDAVRHTFGTWPELERFAWQTKYPQAQVRTKVEATIQRSGLTFAPPRTPIGEIIRPK